ncbi:response regulator, partial [Vibrio parahaemolyticus V-223/04]
HQSRL